MSKNIANTGPDWSRPVVNWFWSGPVRTGLVTAKNHKRPVCNSPVRFFAGLGKMRTSLGLGLRCWSLKTETGPDFQSLLVMAILKQGVEWEAGCISCCTLKERHLRWS